MKFREKNPLLKELVERMYRDSFQTNAKVWRAVARELNRPRRRRFEVNLARLERYAKPKETILVPGVVLGFGEVTKKLTVAALRFSKAAKEKIEKAGGKCLTIEELYASNPKGKRIRIMG